MTSVLIGVRLRFENRVCPRTKNRHLLGFDNPAKALLTTVKEAVDNSLDA